MKRKYLVLGMLALTLKGKPQIADTGYQKKVLSKTEINLVYSQYMQDGDHSAVTGGRGTEKLEVYAPGFSVSFLKGKNSLSLSAGGDVISSASTDRIDSIPSSASRVDLRSHTRVGYSRILSNGIEFGAGTGFSMESDYLSIPVTAHFSYAEPGDMRTYQVSVEMFFDDLRWGRLNPEFRKPVTLIYPAELRYKEWFDDHNRYSFNFKTGFTQVVNRRLLVGLYPEFIVQTGLLSTPYHRVYFKDADLRVENLPGQRYRFPISFHARYFAGSQTILKPVLGYYSDNFGISSGFLELEATFKLKPLFSLSPFIHLYSQTGSTHFQPYGKHNPATTYYTSDYDLSAFNMLKTGLALRWAPYYSLTNKLLFDELTFRYAFMARSDKLQAHMFTVFFSFGRQNIK